MAEIVVLNVRELAERWNVTTAHIYKLCKAMRLPFFDLSAGSKCSPRFLLSEIEKLEKGNQKPAETQRALY